MGVYPRGRKRAQSRPPLRHRPLALRALWRRGQGWAQAAIRRYLAHPPMASSQLRKS